MDKKLSASAKAGGKKLKKVLPRGRAKKKQEGYKIPLMKEGAKIKSPEDIVKALREEYKAEKRECFGSVMLSTRNDVIGDEVIGIGTLNACMVHPREVFRPAIKAAARSVVLVHNHPSGDPTPSRQDRELSERIKEAGEIVGIEVLDFLVIGSESWVSFKEKGLL